MKNPINTILDRFGYAKKDSLPVLKNEASQPSPKQQEQIVKLTEHTRLLYKIDISHWRNAHQVAIDSSRPRRDLLMDVYEDALLDTHLKSVTESRLLSVLNIPFEVVDEATGEIDEQITGLLTKRWFFKYIKTVLESRLYGFSVVCLKLKHGVIDDINVIPRWNVIPEQMAIIPDLNLEELVRIDTPQYNHLYTMLGSDQQDLGLLLQATRFTIFKKHSIQHWGKFQQLFGMPMRLAKSNSRDKKVLGKIENNLKNMGAAMYAVMPLGTEIELKESSNTDAFKVYSEGINLANKEISKLLLGGTMLNEDGSSHSQSKEHAKEKNELIKADIRFCEFEINDKFFTQLMRWGVPLTGKRFRFNLSRKLPLAVNQLQIDKWLATMFELDPDYIRNTYGTVIGDRINAQLPPGNQGAGKEPEQDSENNTKLLPGTNITAQVQSLYNNNICTHANNQIIENIKEISKKLKELLLKVIQKVFKKELKAGDIDQSVFEEIAQMLWHDVQEGYGTKLIDTVLDSTDYKMLTMLQENVYTFAIFKTHHNISAITELLIDSKTGKLRSESEFIKEARKLNETYYKHHLRTERNTVISSSQSASRWQQWQEEKDVLPNVKFQTAGDDRVRSSHRKLEGVVVSIDDPLLKVYNSPLDHGCRCEWIQTDEELRAPKELPKVPLLFQNNPGESGEIFTEEHPFWSGISEKKKKEYKKIVNLAKKTNKRKS